MRPTAKLFNNLLVITLLLIISTSFSYGQDKTSKSNLKIFVEYRLAKANLLTDDNISVEIEGNNIILSGVVPSLYAKDQAEEEAQSVDESYKVVNKLVVQTPNVGDANLLKTVKEKISNNLFYGIYDWVSPSCNNGVVTLNGWVHLPWLKKQFQREIEKIPGVKEVVNNVKSTFGPGNLGIRLARIIYNDPMFYGYQYSSNPPVHIIVNNDRVILEGEVSSQMQKDWAYNMAQYRTDAISVENNLTVKNDN